MVNLKINLLPWRQKRRDRLQREFLNGLAAVGLVAVFLLVGAWRIYEAAIDTQRARVAFIASEIESLDARIAEIRVLQKKRKELLDRMRVIQELQGNRPVSVRLFDELARQLSQNVFFERLTLRGADISVTGVAEDNSRISDQLRAFDQSLWFTGGNVTSIDAFPQAGPEASRFALSVKVSAPSAGAEGN
ncbi:MAG: PilN domain-containing protein [Pseudomonadales bacterium]|mgnify:FL=1|nr:PilN domain-containing protein [Pseudomonadales bacterium]|tara:strand:- start:1146 stop:1715 length:570 start_codon:yes stop_codon:yes gene_type:complete